MGSKIVIFLVVLILLIGVGGFFGYKYAAMPHIVSENSYMVSSCTDTDGNDIYLKGYVNMMKVDEPGEPAQLYESPDYCEIHPKSGIVLREGWCEGNNYMEIRTTCGYGHSCVDGACV